MPNSTPLPDYVVKIDNAALADHLLSFRNFCSCLSRIGLSAEEAGTALRQLSSRLNSFSYPYFLPPYGIRVVRFKERGDPGKDMEEAKNSSEWRYYEFRSFWKEDTLCGISGKYPALPNKIFNIRVIHF